jgi:transposase
VDAFWRQFEPLWEREQLASGRRRRATRLSSSEIMTLLVLFQQSGYRTFKGFYTQHVQTQLRAEFPQLVSYSRFVALIPRVLLPLAVYLQTQLGTCTGISFVDSTSLVVCHNARIAQHRAASRLCGRCAARQDLGRLVLWLQIVHDLRLLLRRAAERPHAPTAVILDSRTLQSTPPSGARAGYDGAERRKGSKVHPAVNTLGELLALVVTPTNEQDRAQVERLAAAVQEVTGETVELAYVDQGYTGDAAE